MRGVLTRTSPVLHGAARESLGRVPEEVGQAALRAGSKLSVRAVGRARVGETGGMVVEDDDCDSEAPIISASVRLPNTSGVAATNTGAFDHCGIRNSVASNDWTWARLEPDGYYESG